MADNEIKSFEMFWSRDESCLLSEGNNRPTMPVNGRKVREIKAKIPAVKPTAKVQLQNNKQTSGGKSASIRDLCKEDKKRVADLIGELARVGEEREGAVKCLDDERQIYERELNLLQQQQQKVLTDRNAIQQELWECQLLLAQYQQQIVHQTDHNGNISKEKSSKKVQKSKKKKRDRTPTRATYDEPIDEGRYKSLPDQHSNYSEDERWNSKSTTDTTSVARSEESNVVSLTPNRHIRVPSSPSKRKFTQKLNKLIDSRATDPVYDDGILSRQTMGDYEVETLPLQCVNSDFPTSLLAPSSSAQDIPSSSGPDHVLSSTQKSDATSSIPEPIFSKPPSTIRSDDFRPLIPDVPNGSQSTLCTNNDSSGYEVIPGNMQRTVGFNPHVQEKSPEQLTSPHDGHQEAQHLKLCEQRRTLELEQERLKQILADQEMLLLNKQQQLRQQHLQQQHRLQQFQLTGKFPDVALMHEADGRTRDGVYGAGPYGTRDHGNLVHPHMVPTQVPHVGHPHMVTDMVPTTQHIDGMDGVDDVIETCEILNGINKLQLSNTHNQYQNGRARAEEPRTESLENEEFLQRHGININTHHQEQRFRNPVNPNNGRSDEVFDALEILNQVNYHGNNQSQATESLNSTNQDAEESRILDEVFFM